MFHLENSGESVAQIRSAGLLIACVVALTVGCSAADDSATTASEGESPCQGSTPSGQLEPLVVTVSEGMTSLPYVQWGVDSGCFESHGLEVVVQTSSSSAVDKVAAILGGSSDIGADGISEIVPALVGEGFAGEFHLLTNGYGYSVADLEMARAGGLVDGEPALSTVLVGRAGQGFDNLEQLRGRKVGLSTAGSTAVGLRLALEEAGIPLAEVDFVDLGSSERVVALDRGDIDFAALGGTVAITQLAKGATVVAYPGAFLYQGGSVIFYYSMAERIAEKEEEMAAFQRAMEEVNSWLSDPDNIDAFRAYLRDDFGVDPEEAQRFRMPDFSLGIPPTETFEQYRQILMDQDTIIDDRPLPEELVWVAPQ